MLADLAQHLRRWDTRLLVARDVGQVRDVLRRVEVPDVAAGVYPTVDAAVAAALAGMIEIPAVDADPPPADPGTETRHATIGQRDDSTTRRPDPPTIPHTGPTESVPRIVDVPARATMQPPYRWRACLGARRALRHAVPPGRRLFC